MLFYCNSFLLLFPVIFDIIFENKVKGCEAVSQDSFSRCHPAVNFLYFVAVIGFGVIIQHPAYALAGLLGASLYYLLLKGKKGVSFIGSMLGMLLVIALLNPILNTSGEHVLFRLFGRPYTLEAVGYGAALGVIFALTMIWFGCYSEVLTSDKFTALFGNLIPALSLLLVMVLRLIPAFTRKTKQIADARSAIGKGTDQSASCRTQVKSGVSILSALTDWALEGSIITADSMRARGYGCGKRTNFHIYRFGLRDGTMAGLILLLAILVLAMGGTETTFTPYFYCDYITLGFPAYCVLLLIPSAMYLREAIVWNNLKFGT